MKNKKVMTAVLGAGMVGALAASGVALAHQGADMMSGRVTARFVVAANPGKGSTGMVKSMTQSEMNRPYAMYGPDSRHVRVVLHDVHGNRVAQVDIYALDHGGNRVSVRAWDLTPGFHGFHIHSVGICDPGGAKPFTSAGGHFNPTGSPEGMQAGAFPVLLAGPDGQAEATFLDADFKVRDLLGTNGSSIVIHALADNYANIPNRYSAGGAAGPDMETQMTGDGGGRVACGVIAEPRTATSPSPQPSPSASSSMPGMSPSSSPVPPAQPTPSLSTVTGPHY